MVDKLKKPPAENQLKALESYQKIHTAREALFDNITRIAAMICDAPISIINLKPHDFHLHQSAKDSKFKITFKETEFCSYALIADEIFEVPDASKDPRFKDNPIVISEPKILFYVGVPLINRDGERQGTLCVIDKKTKQLNESQRQILKILATMIITVFETKQTILADMQQIKTAQESVTDYNQKLQTSLLNQQKYNMNMTALEEMSGVMQACQNYKEAYKVIAQYCQKVFPKVKGSLYFMNENHQFVELVAHFGFKEVDEGEKAFLVNDCWGLRLGNPHQCFLNNDGNPLLCNHVHHKSKFITSYSCLPLSSQGDIFGLLYLEFSQVDEKIENEASLIFRKTFAEQISLSLSNLRLRTTLQRQSITDPLTGLFNRRYYQENIDWIMHKNNLMKRCLAFVMIDIDFFKKFNDSHGHDAGDVVLIKVTEIIKKFVRNEDDIICRMGGEEFLLIIHDSNEDNIKAALQNLRESIGKIAIIYNNQALQTPSISIGVAFLKDNIVEPNVLLIEADKALYVSKENGRNRITYA